jgi:hypothetical protein
MHALLLLVESQAINTNLSQTGLRSIFLVYLILLFLL